MLDDERFGVGEADADSASRVDLFGFGRRC
jgi:hypothetical protein